MTNWKATVISGVFLKEAESQLLAKVEANWLALEKEVRAKGEWLQATKRKADLGAALSDVDLRLKKLEEALEQKYNTGDLRSVREALKRHGDLCKQLAVEVELLAELGEPQASSEYTQKFRRLQALAQIKQRRLEADLGVQQAVFDLAEEAKWAEQVRGQLEALGGSSLQEARTGVRKQAELERAIVGKHGPIVERVCGQSRALLAGGEELAEAGELRARLGRVEAAWTELVKLNERRRDALGAMLVEQELLDEVAGVEQLVAERRALVEDVNAAAVSGKEEAVVSKVLVKMELVEDELRAFVDRLEVLAGQTSIEKRLTEVRSSGQSDIL